MSFETYGGLHAKLVAYIKHFCFAWLDVFALFQAGPTKSSVGSGD
jgi:hypothetical protein